MDEEEQGHEELWKEMVRVTKEAAESCIPKKQKMRKQWLTEDTLDIGKRRREANANGNQQKLDKEYNQQALEDRQKYLEENCQEAENAHQVGDMKNVFSVVRELTNKWTPRSDVINDSNGNTLTEEADIKARWVEYSSNLYKRQPGDKPSNAQTGIKEPAPPDSRSSVGTKRDQGREGTWYR